MTPRFRTVILDVDSTLSRIEGIEWLARLRGDELFNRINEVTERAMRGELEFDGVYAARLDAVRPTRDEMRALADAYVENISPNAAQTIARLKADGVRVMIVSGGMLEPVLHLAAHVRILSTDVYAVPVFFDDNGQYAGYDAEHPCSRQLGKRTVVSALTLDRPVLLVGDGMTDAEVRPAVDAFAAFTGAVRREKIVALADFEVTSFPQLFEQISE